MSSLKNIKKVCIISDAYLPLKISAAGMIYNLSKNISDSGVEVTCVFSGEKPDENFDYDINNLKFITTNILKSFRSKSLIHRFIFEITIAVTLSIKCLFFLQKKK